jgi:4'-phosphopantetheinyl transferase
VTDAVHLARDEVHCWYVDLDVPPETEAACCATLSGDERRRGARFRFDRDRRRFVVAHGALRALLGRYLRTPPGRLRFVHNAFGKPELGPEFGRRLTFNLSHSADLAAIAVAHAEVGVDVERVREQPEYDEIARRHFSAYEVDELSGLPSRLRAQAFFICWTRKEAYAKARGEGLAMASANFSVLPTAGRAHVSHELHGSLEPRVAPSDTSPAEHWSFHSLHPAPGYVGAVAVEGRGWRLTEREWLTDSRAGVPERSLSRRSAW